MKTLIIICLILFSCGKNSSPDKPKSSIEQSTSGLKCLEENLKWEEKPPMERKSLLKTFHSEFDNCQFSEEDSKAYIQRVLEKHPSFFSSW